MAARPVQSSSLPFSLFLETVLQSHFASLLFFLFISRASARLIEFHEWGMSMGSSQEASYFYCILFPCQPAVLWAHALQALQRMARLMAARSDAAFCLFVFAQICKRGNPSHDDNSLVYLTVWNNCFAQLLLDGKLLTTELSSAFIINYF